jgi:hypothetical protein
MHLSSGYIRHIGEHVYEMSFQILQFGLDWISSPRILIQSSDLIKLFGLEI